MTEIDKVIQKYIQVWKIKAMFCGLILIILMYLYFIRKASFFPIFLVALLIFEVIENIKRMNNFKKIRRYLIENKLINKIGMFELSNHIDYIIAEKYMIVVFKKKIYCFSYADIERIIKVDEYRFYPNYLYHKYLTIVLKNGKKVRLLAFSTVCFGQENIDVEKCLLEKNSKIIIEKEKTRIHWLK